MTPVLGIRCHLKRKEREPNPARPAGRCYCPHVIEVAVARACDEACPPAELARREDEAKRAEAQAQGQPPQPDQPVDPDQPQPDQPQPRRK